MINTPQPLRPEQSVEKAKEPYRVPNALENSSLSADVRNVHELSSSVDNISESIESVNEQAVNELRRCWDG